MQSTTTRVSPETLLAALNYVHRVGKARIGTLSEALGKGKGTAKTALRQLLDEGRLDKIGHWYFPKSGIKSGIIRVGPTPEVQCGDSQQSGIKSGIKSGIISVSDQNRASSIYKSNTQRNDTPENPLVGKGSIGESEDLASSEDETTVISIVSAARLERGGQRDNNLESYRCDVAGIISMLQAIIKERRSGNRKLAQQLTADKVSKSDPRWKMQPYKHLGVYERDLSDALASGTIDYATLRRVLMSISKEIPNWPAKLWGEEAYQIRLREQSQADEWFRSGFNGNGNGGSDTPALDEPETELYEEDEDGCDTQAAPEAPPPYVEMNETIPEQNEQVEEPVDEQDLPTPPSLETEDPQPIGKKILQFLIREEAEFRTATAASIAEHVNEDVDKVVGILFEMRERKEVHASAPRLRQPNWTYRAA